MADAETAAPTAGAQPVTQSIDASQAAVEQSILSAIQANAAKAEAPAADDPASPSGEAPANDNPFATPAEDAQTEPEPSPDQAAVPETEEQQAQPETQESPKVAPEAIRQLIKQSNIDPARKEELTARLYKAERYEKVGFTPEHAEALKDLGVTPEVIIERTQIHPTLEDARRDASLAASMRAISEDLTSNPAAFLDKLSQANPAITENIRAAILGGIQSPEDLGEDKWFPFVQESTWNLLENLSRSAARDGDADLKEAAQIIRNKVFGQNAQRPQPQPKAPATDDPNNPLVRELNQLRAQNQQREQATRASWASSMQNEGFKAVGELANQYLASQGLTNLPGTFSQDAARELGMSVLGAIQSDPRLAADAQTFLAGPMTPERFQQGLAWLKSRTAPLINVHGQKVREKYRALLSAAPKPTTTTQPKPAPRPDVARPSGAAARPTAGPNPTQQVFAAAAKGMTIEQMIAANSAARRR